MKLKSAGLSTMVILLAVSLGACSSSTKAAKGQAAPQPAQRASKTFTGDTGKFKDSRPLATAAKADSKTDKVMLMDVHFDYDKYNVRPADADILKKDYAWFKANPSGHVAIEGNCDERGSIEYNLALGQKRADATKNFLMMMGVQEKAIKTISYGKEKPVDPGHDEAAWAKNRRAHLAPDKL